MKITALARGKSLLFFCENMAVLPVDWGLLLSLSGSIAGEIGKIAVFFPADSDLLTGDGFECDCVRHHALSQVSGSRNSSAKSPALRRDFNIGGFSRWSPGGHDWPIPGSVSGVNFLVLAPRAGSLGFRTQAPRVLSVYSYINSSSMSADRNIRESGVWPLQILRS